jgi:hypothetical protein
MNITELENGIKNQLRRISYRGNFEVVEHRICSIGDSQLSSGFFSYSLYSVNFNLPSFWAERHGSTGWKHENMNPLKIIDSLKYDLDQFLEVKIKTVQP